MPRRKAPGSPSNGSLQRREHRSWASWAGVRTGSWTRPVLQPLADQLDRVAQRNDGEHLDRLGQERPGDDRADVDLIRIMVRCFWGATLLPGVGPLGNQANLAKALC